MKLAENNQYKEFVKSISTIYNLSIKSSVSAVNVEMINAYWGIGKYIIDFEQKGNVKAQYGTELLLQLSQDLNVLFGKGFSRSNLSYMRKFYHKYPNRETVSHKLSWSHYFLNC